MIFKEFFMFLVELVSPISSYSLAVVTLHILFARLPASRFLGKVIFINDAQQSLDWNLVYRYTKGLISYTLSV